jgi:hypothetical protein
MTAAFIMLAASNSLAVRIKITADYTHYDKYRDVLIAKGNVKVTGPDFNLESPYVIRHFKDEKIVAMDKFTLEREGYRISGSQLEFYYTKGTGNAERVRINFGETFLGGRYMTMDNDKFTMYDAYYTGCDESSTHYHISGQELTLYPNTGLIVAYYATCWVWIAPIIPVPTFVYSAPVPRSKFIVKTVRPKSPSRKVKEEKEGVKTTQPIPELGANPVDGPYFRQGFNWYFTPRSYARVLLSYNAKTYFGADLSTNYIFNDANEGEVRIGSNELEHSYWGISHYLSFGEKLVTKDDEQYLLYDFYKPGGKYSYEIETRYSQRERPNGYNNIGPFTRVTLTPKITLRSNRKPVPMLGEAFTYYFEASTAQVSEEVSEPESPITTGYALSSQVDNYYADILYGADWGWFGNFNAGVDVASSRYDGLKGQSEGITIEAKNFQHWDRAEQKVSLQQTYFDHLALTYAHNHYINQDGASPYKYEGYWYSQYDTFSGTVKYKAWWSYLSMTANYNLPSWDLNNVKYELMFGMHCYNLIFQYVLKNDIDAYRGQFNFSFELAPSKW